MYQEGRWVKIENIIKIIEKNEKIGKISPAASLDIIHEIYEETTPSKYHKP